MRTYQHDIPLLSSVMRSIVSDVEQNLVTDDDLEIAQVQFRCETWLELIKRLNEDSKDAVKKQTRYPLVALIRDFTESIEEDTNSYETSLNIVIVTQSDANKTSTEREEDNYIPTLIPIYMELMSVLRESSYFLGSPRLYFPHSRSFNMHLGTTSDVGNTAYKLPDCVDGIVIENLKLNLDIDNCEGFFYGSSASLVYQNQIIELSVTGIGTNVVRVTLDDYVYENSYHVGIPSPTIGIYFAHVGVEVEFIIGVDIYGEEEVTVMDDGFYTGYLFQYDTISKAKLAFGFVVQDGLVRGYTSSNYHNLTQFILSGYEYINYPFNLEFYLNYTYPMIEKYEISQGGNVIFENDFVPNVSSIPLTVKEVELPIPQGLYREILTNIIINGESLESFAYYKTI